MSQSCNYEVVCLPEVDTSMHRLTCAQGGTKEHPRASVPIPLLQSCMTASNYTGNLGYQCFIAIEPTHLSWHRRAHCGCGELSDSPELKGISLPRLCTCSLSGGASKWSGGGQIANHWAGQCPDGWFINASSTHLIHHKQHQLIVSVM